MHADKIRDAVLNLIDEDAAAAAQIRKGSDRILTVADQIHKRPLPTRSQVEHWSTSHVDETRQYMFDAVKSWRTAGVAHEHAIDMYEVAADNDRKGLPIDTAGLRDAADSLRAHASQMTLIDRHYHSDAIQPSIYACNEAIARINEKHTAIAARLNDTANKLTQAADDYDTPAANRPRCIRQRPH
ncbi:hypothetical protein AWC26_18595 [Mycobacterium shimoidei]|nr:hypothetical protein BHQ16_21870 [Mycobacterium shimoidei]ORW77945.1 hypothetical protein AWC26_18595 [Mycobacterium shimoidei]